MHKGLVALIVALSALLVTAGSAHAAVFDVNTTDDTRDADPAANTPCADTAGKCSLRAAIDQANSNIGEDTINLPNGRYVLTLEGSGDNQNESGDLDIGWTGPEGGDTNIVGESTEDTIVDANGLDRVFHIFDGTESETSIDVDLSDLTVTGGFSFDGSSGGGILNEIFDTLTLLRVRVTRNSALGAGGIANHGHTVILESTVDRNSSLGQGGGICSSGELNVADSTVNDNASGTFLFIGGDGGGIFAGSRGDCEAGIVCGECGLQGFVAGASADGVATNQIEGEPDVTIENSTIDGNDAYSFGTGGGLALYDQTATLLNVTLSDNVVISPDTNGGGGIYAQGDAIAEFKNTIVADNRVNGEHENCSGEGFVDLGHNLENRDDCGFTERTSKKETPALLERLTDNGGPTHTRALRDGSQALDSADNDACPADDQRGRTRPPDATNAGPACDIGAYERIDPPAPPAPQTIIQQQQTPPQQTPQGEACTAAPPRTSVSRNSLIARETTVKFTGRSIDFRCGETRLPGEVVRVQLAVARIVSNTADSSRCQFLTTDGDLSRTRACDDEVFQNARLGTVRNGKVPWTFRKRRLDLPAGRYRVIALATDSDGVAETEIRRFNLKRFSIR